MDKIKKQGCLVLLDLQQGFINYNKEIIPNIKDLLNKYEFDRIVATEYINMPYGPYHDLLKHKEIIENDKIMKLNPFIKSISERVFDKNKSSCFTSEFMSYYLNMKVNNIEKLYFTGMGDTNCILSSVLDCIDNKINFEIFINQNDISSNKKSEKDIEYMLKAIAGKDKLIYY